MNTNITQIEFDKNLLTWTLYLEIKGETIKLDIEPYKAKRIIKTFKHFNKVDEEHTLYYVFVKQ